MVPKDTDLACQPMFCFETMMKLLYWSCFVYDHKKVCTSVYAVHGSTGPWALHGGMQSN